MPGVWVFGYGSLVWRPDIAFREWRVARVQGWKRRFWQGSHDHRGVPHAPGRVVTLVLDRGESCEGVAYFVDESVAEATLRGSTTGRRTATNGTPSVWNSARGRVRRSRLHRAGRQPAWLGPAPEADMVEQIRRSAGPSGANIDYLRELAAALRDLGIDDTHVFTLERLALEAEDAG